jgi:hypothetical protein
MGLYEDPGTYAKRWEIQIDVFSGFHAQRFLRNYRQLYRAIFIFAAILEDLSYSGQPSAFGTRDDSIAV